MKNKTVNIIALLVLASIFLMRFDINWSVFKLQNKIKQTNQEVEENDKLRKEYNSKIKSIYELADSDLNSSIILIEETRIQYPNKLTDLEYVEARILLTKQGIGKAEILIEKLKQNSKYESPRFLELYAYFQIEKGNIDIGERSLQKATQLNKDFKYQLANLYELKSDFDMAIKLYNEIIAKNPAFKDKAIRRKELLELEIGYELTNIELNDDSERFYFSTGKFNIK